MGQTASILSIHAIDWSGSVVDGPGIRTVVYLQGCDRRCAGCHNPRTWDWDAGIRIPVDDLVAELRSNVANRKLTISGGEPLLQSPAVIAMLRALPGFSVALYTGAELDDVPAELLGCLDYIKVGRYVDSLRTTTTPFVGSSNQRFMDVRGEHP